MERIDTLLTASWVIPVEPSGRVLAEHSIAVDRGRIVAVLPSDEARRRFSAEREARLDGRVLIPGLVNTHTHACAEMMRGGVTCFNDMYFYPDQAGTVASGCGMRATIGLIVVDFPTVWARDTDEYLAKGTEVHDRFRDDPLVHTAFTPHAPYSVSDAAFARVRTLADELDIPVHIHVHETADEVADGVRDNGERPLARLDRLGLLNHRLVAVHMIHLNDAEIARLAECAASVVHCPESNLKLANGFCPVQRLLDAGINVALGTDGAASNNDLDVHGEMRTAADVVAIDLRALETQPVHDPLSHVVYACSRNHVTDVWIAGRAVIENRHLLTLDEERLTANAEQWRQRMTADDKRRN